MQIQSPLSNLRDVLSQVRESAKANKLLLMNNEDATRAALIDPVLYALGWRTSEVTMVKVETKVNYSNSTLRADYALYDSNSKEAVVIEAKSPGQNLSQEWPKMIAYASAFGVTTIFLTDGLIWQHFDTRSVNTSNITPVGNFDIATSDLGEIAVHLVQYLDAAIFWPEEQNSDAMAQDVEQLRSDVETLKQQIVALRRIGSQGNVSGTLGNNAIIVPSQQWTDIDALPSLKNNRPTQLRLPNRQEVHTKYWKDVLVECCKFALANDMSIPVPLLDRSHKTVELLRTVKPPKGIAHLELTYNGQQIYVYTNYDAEHCIENALYILQQMKSVATLDKPAVVYGPA